MYLDRGEIRVCDAGYVGMDIWVCTKDISWKEIATMKIDAVIFDVDGTLWDTTDLVAHAWNRAVKQCGILNPQIITSDILKKEFGKPMDIIMNNLFPQASKKEQEDILKLCSKYEQELLINTKENLLYPGVMETIKELSKTCKVCIVSNCQVGYIELFLKKYHLEEYVTDTECFGNTRFSKGENIKLVLERNEFSNIIYVGDTMGDYEATCVAKVPFVFAAYGFGEVAKAEKKIDNISEVLEFI